MPPTTRQESRRRGYAVTGLVVIACIPLDLLMLGGWSLPAVAIRAVWGASYLACAAIYPRLSPRLQGHTNSFVGLMAMVSFAPLVLILGGASSPLFAWHIGIPMAVAVIVQTDVRTVVHVSIFSLVSTFLVGLRDLSASALAAWVLLVAVSCVVALYGVLTARRLQFAELAMERAAERSRMDAELRLLESQQRTERAERLAVVGQLSAGVAHEINNPLAYVSANLGYVRENLGGSAHPDLIEACDEAIEGVGRIRTIVHDLRSFARESGETLEDVNLHSVIAEALRVTRSRLKGVARVEWAPAPSIPTVRANHARLLQVLVNLLLNAADAIESSKTAPGLVTLQARSDAGGVSLDVCDNGPGIPPEIVSRLFQPFFTTKAPGKGTGLGLALSREYVERFGGTLTVRDESPRGACFRIHFVPQAPTS